MARCKYCVRIKNFPYNCCALQKDAPVVCPENQLTCSNVIIQEKKYLILNYDNKRRNIERP